MMKKILIVTSALCLSACGFTPMHAPQIGDNGRAFKNIQIEMIEVDDVAKQEGAFWVQQALYDRLGQDGRVHRLAVESDFNRASIGISSQDVATRYDMRVTLNYKLINPEDEKVLTFGRVRATSTFGAPIDPYGRSISEQAATKNVAKEAVDRLLIELAAYYAKAEDTSP